MNVPVPAPIAAAGFWHRYAAWSLDALVVSTAVLLLAWSRVQAAWLALGVTAKATVSAAGSVLADAMMAGTQLPQLPGVLLADPRLGGAAATLQSALWQLCWPLLLGYAVLAAPWHILGECSRWRGSPGKRALGLAVVDGHGDSLSAARATLRHVAALLSWLTFNLGHLMAAWSPTKRALHDRVAGARVVATRAGARLPGWARAWIALQALALFALWAWLLLRYVAALEAGIPAL